MGNAYLQRERAIALSGSIHCLTGTSLSFTGEDVLSFSGQMGVGDGLLPGAVVAQQCTLMLHDREGKFTVGASLFGARVHVEIQAGEEKTPLAVFYVSGVAQRDASTCLTLSGTDALGCAFEAAWQDTLSYPCTLGQVARQVAAEAGCSLAGDAPLMEQALAARPDWGEISRRGVLACIAQACGCFCRVAGDGSVLFQPVWNPDAIPYEIFPENTFKREYGDASFGPLKGLVLSLHGAKRDADPLVIRADETPLDGYNSLSIAHNPLFSLQNAQTEAMARRLLSALEGMNVTRLMVHWQGDGAVGLGQRIRVHDTRGGFTDTSITSLGYQADQGFSMQTDCNFQRPSASVGRLFTPSGGLNAAMLHGTSDGAFLKAESITTQHLAAQAVTTEKLGAASVTAEKIAAGEVKTGHLAAESVTADVIAAASIRGEHLAAGAVTAEKIAAGEIAAHHIQGKSITAAQLAAGLITADNGLIDTGAIGTAQIADGSITEAKIVSLNADVIQSGTLKTDRLMITGEGGLVYEINASSSGLTQTELEEEAYLQKMDGSVLVAKSVTAAQIASQTITANEILSGAITTEKLDAQAVTADKLAANSVTVQKIASDVGSSLDLSSNQSVLLMVGQLETAITQAPGQQMTLTFDRSNALESDHPQLTVQVHVWRNGTDVTEELPLSAFTWQRHSGDEAADALWEEGHKALRSVTLTREEIGKSCQLSCTLKEPGDMGSFTIENGELIYHGDAEDAENFSLENGDLMAPSGFSLTEGELYQHTMTVTTAVFDHSVLETSHILIRDQRIDIKTGGDLRLAAGGTFTVESGNFNIDAQGNVQMNGRVEAGEGKIGGWEIGTGALASGEDASHVCLSTADTAYGLWAGAEEAQNAPFRVARDGTVFLTRLYVTDENGTAQSQPVNLRTSYWKMDAAYAKAVKTLSVDAATNTLTIELNDGTSVNFKKAASSVIPLVQTWSGGRMVISTQAEGVVLSGETTISVNSAPGNLSWDENHVATFDVTSDRGNIVSGMQVAASDVYNSGWNDGLDHCTRVGYAYSISDYAPGTLYMQVNGNYTSVGSDWVKVSPIGNVYTLPGRKE